MEVNISKFIMIEADVLLNRNLSSTDKLVYGVISALTNNRTSECYASTKYLTKIIGIHERQLRECLKRLKKYNYININIINNNKRIITTKISQFVEDRKEENKQIELLDYNWLEETE